MNITPRASTLVSMYSKPNIQVRPMSENNFTYTEIRCPFELSLEFEHFKSALKDFRREATVAMYKKRFVITTMAKGQPKYNNIAYF